MRSIPLVGEVKMQNPYSRYQNNQEAKPKSKKPKASRPVQRKRAAKTSKKKNNVKKIRKKTK